MSLLFDREGISKNDLTKWIKNDNESMEYVLSLFIILFIINYIIHNLFYLINYYRKFEEAYDKLTKLQMIEQNEKLALNESFRYSFQDCLTGW